MLPVAILAQLGAGDCALSGLCGVVQPERPVASGVFFLAIGLVALGVGGFRRAAR